MKILLNVKLMENLIDLYGAVVQLKNIQTVFSLLIKVFYNNIFFFLGLKDPIFVKPSSWGNRKVMDTGALWAGAPSGQYKVGKTFVESRWTKLKITTYMTDGVTKLEDDIIVPNY